MVPWGCGGWGRVEGESCVWLLQSDEVEQVGNNHEGLGELDGQRLSGCCGM